MFNWGPFALGFEGFTALAAAAGQSLKQFAACKQRTVQGSHYPSDGRSHSDGAFGKHWNPLMCALPPAISVGMLHAKVKGIALLKAPCVAPAPGSPWSLPWNPCVQLNQPCWEVCFIDNVAPANLQIHQNLWWKTLTHGNSLNDFWILPTHTFQPKIHEQKNLMSPARWAP